MRFVSGSQRGDAVAIGITGSLLILASFMVWVQVPVVRMRGVQADGSITAVMGILVVLIAIAAFRDPTRILQWVVLVAFSIATYVSFAFFITWSVDGLGLDDIGPGIPLAMLVSLVGIALAIMWIRVKPAGVSTYIGGSIDTMATVPRHYGWTVASVAVLGLVVAWRVFSAVVGNAPIGGYGDFSDTAYGDVDWDRVAVLVVECAYDQGLPVSVRFEGSGVSFAEVPMEHGASAVRTVDRCEAGLNLPEFDGDGG
ncbi:MAG: hypothetical protein JJE47_10900 [Acidimicrobiia bacterium]|nr:hypothetical protein [Acidimicrobiia bacterium]